MKSLIVDDDFFSRKILQTLFSNYGECHVAVHGHEALFAFLQSLTEGAPYDVICLDIMMPEMDGQKVLSEIREYEKRKPVPGYAGAKIIMTTALDDTENVKNAFRKQCDAYLIKPINKSKVVNVLTDIGLIKE